MFTGLIERTGTLLRLERRGPGAKLTLTASADYVAELALGDSVAVDGACLTVVAKEGAQFTVDASAETLSCTTLGASQPGERFHLERALRLSDRLGGHWVAGHVDATGTVRRKAGQGEALEVWFDAPGSVLRYVVEKGSIAVDGVSLTVNALDSQGFSVVLVPHTQRVVRLADKHPGERVNLEADVIGKYVEKLLGRAQGQGVDLALLARTGFLR